MSVPYRKFNLHLVLFIMVFVCLMTSCSESRLNEANNIAERISTRLVPERREGIADITLTENDNNVILLKGETDCPELGKELTDSLSKSGFTVIDSIIRLPGKSLGEYTYGVVSLSVINLRKVPEHSAELVSQALMGTPVKILKSNGYWFMVQTPDRYIAWTENSSLRQMTENDLKKWRQSPKLICIDNTGWIYKLPDEKEVIGDFVAGCILISAGSAGGYEKVILPDGRSGIVREKSVKNYDDWQQNTMPSGDKICKTAFSLMGIPYLWGGSSAKAVDCSGFVQNVYFLNGLILPRDASLQALYGTPVNISVGYNELQPGDLLFFGSVRNSKPRVTHVAIYTGDSEFIHSSGRVMINSLDSTRDNFSSYRKNSLLSASRIVGSPGSQGIVPVKEHILY